MNQNYMNRGMNQNMMYQRNNSMNRSQGGCCNNSEGWNTATAPTQIPNSCRAELMCFINEVSFAAYEALLYLDTHPDCREALQYFQKYNDLRNKALKIHAKSYGPLTMSTIDDAGCSSWEWMMQPWPWELEGGAC